MSPEGDEVDSDDDAFGWMNEFTPAFGKEWTRFRERWPAVITGAWDESDVTFGDDNPGARIYNMMLVRIPTLVFGTWILNYQLVLKGHLTFFFPGGFALEDRFATLAIVLVCGLILR